MGSITGKVRDEMERENAVKQRENAFDRAFQFLAEAHFDPKSVFILVTSKKRRRGNVCQCIRKRRGNAFCRSWNYFQNH